MGEVMNLRILLMLPGGVVPLGGNVCLEAVRKNDKMAE